MTIPYEAMGVDRRPKCLEKKHPPSQSSWFSTTIRNINQIGTTKIVKYRENGNTFVYQEGLYYKKPLKQNPNSFF